MAEVLDHGRTTTNDMRRLHTVSVHTDRDRDRLVRLGYQWSHGWVDRAGRHGPAGQHWDVYTRKEPLQRKEP